MEQRITRFERKREQLNRTYVVTNGDRNPSRYMVCEGVSLRDAVNDIVTGYEVMARGYIEGRDLAIWKMGKLVAVSRRRQGKDFVTFFADEEMVDSAEH